MGSWSLLCDGPIHHGVNLGPVLFVGIGPDLGPYDVFGPLKGAAMCVADDDELVEVDEAVGDVDFPQSVADIAACVTADDDV